MVRLNVLYTESVLLNQVTQFAFRVGVSDRAPGFRFRVARHHLGQPPEPRFSVGHQDPEYFPRVAVIHHNFYRAARAHIIPDLLEDALRMRCVMDHAKRINQVIRFDRYHACQIFATPVEELDAIRETKNLGAFAGHLERLLGQIHGGDMSAVAGEIHRVRTDAAADFQNAFVPPAGKFGKPRDVRFDEIFSLLDFVKIFPGARRLGRMANVAWPAVPIIPDLLDGYLFKYWRVQNSPFSFFASNSHRMIDGHNHKSLEKISNISSRFAGALGRAAFCQNKAP
jgi:hypothetical protein